ncbi:MAG: hypothetical protein DCC55_19520 [Chloroflexi bacterium]|nr:MAG: hypothetical protein DCC55_19520 [Chloroflexota bacterium]
MNKLEPHVAVLEQRRILWIVLVLNLLLVTSLAATGILADSNGLLANALEKASDATIYIFTPWLSFADYWPSSWADWTGAAIFGIGFWGLWRTHAALG